MAERPKIGDIRPDPEDDGINEHWMSILRLAVQRSGKSAVLEVTPEEHQEAIEAWKRGERPVIEE